MARRKRKTEGNKSQKLTPEEVATAATRMMSAAQVHQRASVWCTEKPSSDPPDIDSLYFFSVSFELLLQSIEQSLRLLLMLQHSILRPTHNIHALYKILQNQSGRDMRMRNEIVGRSNVMLKIMAQLRKQDLKVFTEPELVSCLRRHDSSYTNFRYFGLDEQGRLDKNAKWELTPTDINMMHCFALALLDLNADEMRSRKIGMPALRKVPKSETPPHLKAFMEKVKSPG